MLFILRMPLFIVIFNFFIGKHDRNELNSKCPVDAENFRIKSCKVHWTVNLKLFSIETLLTSSSHTRYTHMCDSCNWGNSFLCLPFFVYFSVLMKLCQCEVNKINPFSINRLQISHSQHSTTMSIYIQRILCIIFSNQRFHFIHFSFGTCNGM